MIYKLLLFTVIGLFESDSSLLGLAAAKKQWRSAIGKKRPIDGFEAADFRYGSGKAAIAAQTKINYLIKISGGGGVFRTSSIHAGSEAIFIKTSQLTPQ